MPSTDAAPLFPDAMVDGSTPDADARPPGGCDPTDTDGDGIADVIEGMGDADGDGIPSFMDDDSDGDGYLDSEEAGDTPCLRRDTDGDGLIDSEDTDSDSDGLSDARERGAGTNPRDIDTDGDGVTDLGEVDGTMTDPLDETSTIPDRDFFLVLPHNGERQMRTLRFGTAIAMADVYFLVDTTGSMSDERTNLINGLVDTIVPGIQAAVPDVHFGAGGFDDYPIDSYGSAAELTYGSRRIGPDLPYYQLLPMSDPEADDGGWSLTATATMCPADTPSSDIGTIVGMPNMVPDILDAIRGLPCHNGGDLPESFGPALYATASGMGLTWTGGGSIPGRTCPEGTIGYPCFRVGALPIILMFGDADFHNGPAIESPYSFADAPTYAMTLDALTGIGARVIGIRSGSLATAHFEQIATDTGAVTTSMDGTMTTPLVFAIGADGSGLDTAVVDAVTLLASATPQDVSTRTDNVMGNPDGFDATTFIKSVVPVEGYAGCTGMECETMGVMPGVTYTSKDDATFYAVIPGVQVEFAIDFFNDVRPPARNAEIFRARIVVVGNGVADLDLRNVYIIVPPEGETITII